MANLKVPRVFHPLLFAAFPVLFLFTHNAGQVPLSQLWLALSAVLVVTLTLSILLNRAMSDPQKAGMLLCAWVLLFFSFGRARDLLALRMGQGRYLLLAWGLAGAAAAYFTARLRRDLSNVTSFLNATAICLVLLPAWRACAQRPPSTRSMVAPPSNASSRHALRPDIYYIILDGYARADTLRGTFGFDNTGFLDYLSKKGFRVAGRSRSNYALTHLSLASSLNMTYLDKALAGQNPASQDFGIPFALIQHNAVIERLKQEGYRIVHASSGWGPTLRLPQADKTIQCGWWSEFFSVLLRTTALAPFEERIALLVGGPRERLLCTLSQLEAVPGLGGPKFVFAHMLLPHPPFVFGPNGEAPPGRGTSFGNELASWEPKQGYSDQLAFTNKKMQGVIDAILARSKTPPVIILQADHGSGWGLSHVEEGREPAPAVLNERHRIFAAYYLPKPGAGPLENRLDALTPVNIFRLVFDSYLGEHLPLLDDRVYFSAYRKPYAFRDVTAVVR